MANAPAPDMSNVVQFPRPTGEPQQKDGDGGGGDEIVVRIVVDWPETPEVPEAEPEPKSGRLGGFLWGVLFGWWLGG